jgi:hypothetical protein
MGNSKNGGFSHLTAEVGPALSCVRFVNISKIWLIGTHDGKVCAGHW